jgi:UDP-2,4-diacetamido-2,4,6-trideoxy-beta-L-altropyranose hydrolase
MRILIRADGDHGIGTGHVTRMLALAQVAGEQGGTVTLASAILDAQWVEHAKRMAVDFVTRALEPGSEEDVGWVTALSKTLHADWVLADGYPFAEDFQAGLRAAQLPFLWVDDFGHCEHYTVDFILNQNHSADPALYRARADHTGLLLGARYALLREEFRAGVPADVTATPDVATRILVTFGGSDPVDGTRGAIEARVLVGPSNPRIEAYRSLVGSDVRITLLAGSEDIAGLMAWSQLAMTAAGTTTYALCRMGVPSLLVVVADNQEALTAAADRRGVAVNLGWHDALSLDSTLRAKLGARGQEEVDGLGCERVLKALYPSDVPRTETAGPA